MRGISSKITSPARMSREATMCLRGEKDVIFTLTDLSVHPSPPDDLVSDDLVWRRRLSVLSLVQVAAQVERHVLGVREAGIVVHAL